MTDSNDHPMILRREAGPVQPPSSVRGLRSYLAVTAVMFSVLGLLGGVGLSWLFLPAAQVTVVRRPVSVHTMHCLPGPARLLYIESGQVRMLDPNGHARVVDGTGQVTAIDENRDVTVMDERGEVATVDERGEVTTVDERGEVTTVETLPAAPEHPASSELPVLRP